MMESVVEQTYKQTVDVLFLIGTEKETVTFYFATFLFLSLFFF